MNNANPSWWKDEHTSTWDRVKGALRRDWEQTKADFSSKGKELNQGVTDTVKQAAGVDPLPPANVRTPDDNDWADEDAQPYRYGAGASHQYRDTYRSWDDQAESKLREEWGDMKSGKTWDEVKSAVRRGWDRVRS